MLEHQFENADLFLKTNHSDYFRFNSNYTKVLKYVWSNSFQKRWVFSLSVCV